MKTERKMIMLMLLLVVLLCGCKAEEDDKKPTEASTPTATTQPTSEPTAEPTETPTATPTVGGEIITVPEGHELVHRRIKEIYYVPEGDETQNHANKGKEFMVREYTYDEYGNCVTETSTGEGVNITKKSAYDEFGAFAEL